MKRQTITIKLERPKRRHQFLFNDGEFRPKQEKLVRGYQRRDKHGKSTSKYQDMYS